MIVTIIIPVYNEKNLISRTLDEVLASKTAPFDREIIIVDDGSTDGSQEILDVYKETKGSVKVIRHPVNVGKGASIRTGLRAANGDIILIQDGDLEYSPRDYLRLLEPFSDPQVDAVYGSRFLERSWPTDMKAINWVANKIFTCLVNGLYGARLTDEGTAYKVFRRNALSNMTIECSGFDFCPEVTVKLLKQHARIAEVPISYSARSKREGKKPGPAAGFKILWTILKYRFPQ